MAAEAGQLELNAFEPVIFYKLFESVTTLTRGVRTLTEHCVKGIAADSERCSQMVLESAGVAAALCPHVGYARASRLAKEALATGLSVQALARRDKLLPEARLMEVLDPIAMTSPQPVRRKTPA
jgi:aspartate ammonia-lyase